MIAVADYGVRNLFSLCASLKYLGIDTEVTKDPKKIKEAEKIILPGVGAFGDAIKKLEECGLSRVIKEEAKKGKPLLGICLGMQLLFERSLEYGIHSGLGLIEGEVRSIKDDMQKEARAGFKVPHIGWNRLDIDESDPLFKYIKNREYVYYVHSFYAGKCAESVIASSYHGIEITGACRRGSIWGTQFHPEKSGTVGLNILKAFTEV